MRHHPGGLRRGRGSDKLRGAARRRRRARARVRGRAAPMRRRAVTTRCGAAAGFAALGAGLVLLATGCKGEPEVKTYPVSGKVVVKNGDVKKLVGGYVHLESVSDPKLKAVGEIEEGGE